MFKKVEKRMRIVVLVGLLAAGWGSSYAGLPSFMTVTGANQGAIEGDVQQAGKEGTILVVEWHHLIRTPFDPATGAPSGKRQHEPFVFTKIVDKASPNLYNAWKNAESLTVDLKFYRINQVGQEEHYFTLGFTGAKIVAIEPFMPNSLDPANENMTHMERLRMTYQNLLVTFVSGTTAETIPWDSGKI